MKKERLKKRCCLFKPVNDASKGKFSFFFFLVFFNLCAFCFDERLTISCFKSTLGRLYVAAVIGANRNPD